MKEAIILAGGLGTRLQTAVPGLPKALAPVNGKPFLFYVINYLRLQGIHTIIFSLGHLHEQVRDYINAEFETLEKLYVVEEEPLGTGGAIKAALQFAKEKQVLVANGDSLYRTDLLPAMELHERSGAELTMLLRSVENTGRYGRVELGAYQQLREFKEKGGNQQGLINSGIYIINREAFLNRDLPEKFSLEKDYLEQFIQDGKFFGAAGQDYFIDIGIPEDFERAQSEFALPPLDLSQIDHSWTLFLDRDGVINHEEIQDYVRTVDKFRYYDGALEAIRLFSKKFGKVVVATNQRGVGRGLMKQEALDQIHQYMLETVARAGGRIDAVYSCTSLDSNNPCRKPNPGMAGQAKREFPSIDLSRSIMVGNYASDMHFGRNAGMYTVFLETTSPASSLAPGLADFHYPSLDAFARALENA